jgi:hypothetical protein
MEADLDLLAEGSAASRRPRCGDAPLAAMPARDAARDAGHRSPGVQTFFSWSRRRLRRRCGRCLTCSPRRAQGVRPPAGPCTRQAARGGAAPTQAAYERQRCPRRAGQACGMARAWRSASCGGVGWAGCHPIDLPKGYQATARGQAWHGQRRWGCMLPPRCGLIGLCQVDGMARVARSQKLSTRVVRPAPVGYVQDRHTSLRHRRCGR